MLGRRGIEAANRDGARIRSEGKRPLIVLLISGPTVVISSIAVEPPPMPMLH